MKRALGCLTVFVTLVSMVAVAFGIAGLLQVVDSPHAWESSCQELYEEDTLGRGARGTRWWQLEGCDIEIESLQRMKIGAEPLDRVYLPVRPVGQSLTGESEAPVELVLVSEDEDVVSYVLDRRLGLDAGASYVMPPVLRESSRLFEAMRVDEVAPAERQRAEEMIGGLSPEAVFVEEGGRAPLGRSLTLLLLGLLLPALRLGLWAAGRLGWSMRRVGYALPFESFVALRYLAAKKRSSVLSIITLISVSGVALGVTAMIVVLSVMGGFKKDLMQKILGTKAHIVLRAPQEAGELRDAARWAEQARQAPEVVGAAVFIEDEVMVSSPTNLSGVVLRGIDPRTIGQVSNVPDTIIAGELSYLTNAQPLIRRLRARRLRDLDDLFGSDPSGLIDPLEMGGEAGGAAVQAPGGELLPLDAGGEGGEMPSLLDENLTLEESERGTALDGDVGGMPPVFGEGGVDEEAFEDVDDAFFGENTGEMPDIAAPGEEQGGSAAVEGPGHRGGGDDLPGLVIGPELAKSLQVELGDEVNVVTPKGDVGPMGPIPRSRPFRVVGVFRSGMYEYDANYAYTHIEDARDFLGVGVQGASGVELKTRDVEQAVEVAQGLQARLGDRVEVLDWVEMNHSLFYALKLEKIAMFVVLTFIILVASFSIVAMLIMIVIEKGAEIAVLKSIGANNGEVMRTFVFQGTVIGALGAALGLVLGLLICYLLETVGFPLNSEVYYISTLPVDVDGWEVFLVVVCAVVISMLATIYPSFQAARLNPVEGLRYGHE